VENKKISIIGCGNLGLSILNGLLEQKIVKPSNILVTRRNIELLRPLEKKGVRVSADNVKAVKESEIVILALKPYAILEVIKELSIYFNPDKHILVSLAAGISIMQIEQQLESALPVFRAMPNTAADVCTSTTCICSNSLAESKTGLIVNCFNSIGSTLIINEQLMDSATVLGACGIAYVLRFIRAMIQGGIQIGFDVNTAESIVKQTVKGASELLLKRKTHPEFEIDKVTTPKGCTIAGLNEMEHNGFSSSLIKGIVASFEKIENDGK